MKHFSNKGCVAYMNVHVSTHSKEELAWALDKQFQIINNLKQL